MPLEPPWTDRPGDAAACEAWLRDGLNRRIAAPDEEARRRAFRGVVLSRGDYVVALLAAVPQAERMTLALAVRDALAAGLEGNNTPDALIALLSLARRLRPPGIAAALRSLWQRRLRHGTPDGEALDSEIFHTVAASAAAGHEDADRLLDLTWNDMARRQPDFLPLWLRAKIRSGRLRWIEALSPLAIAFEVTWPDLADRARFLDALLDDVGSVEQIRDDIQAHGRAHVEAPWFHDVLFGGLPGLGALHVTRADDGYFLDRIVLPGTRRWRVAGRAVLDISPGEAKPHNAIWFALASLQVERHLPEPGKDYAEPTMEGIFATFVIA
jgi:hypothetical protein